MKDILLIIGLLLFFPQTDFQCTPEKLQKNSLTEINLTEKDSKEKKLYDNSNNISLTKEEYQNLLSNNNTIENSLSIFITALGVLFTVMAIVVAIVIFMQSRDFKIKLTEATDKYELIIKQFIESKRKELKIKEEELTKFISDYQKKLETSKPEQIGEIKNIISQLESQKDIVEKQLKNSIVDVRYVSNSNSLFENNNLQKNKYHKCSKCNFGFIVHEPSKLSNGLLDYGTYLTGDDIGVGLLSEKVATCTCPKCGNVDIL